MKQYEADEQKKLFRWADFMKTEYPELDMMFHIPNGGSRNKLEAANLKKQGVRAGVRIYAYLLLVEVITDCLSSLNLARTRQQQSKTNGLQN